MLCANCANRLASAYDFAMKVSESDKRFVGLLDESSTSKIIEYVDEVELVSNPEIIQIKYDEGFSNANELNALDDSIITVADDFDYDENDYVIKTARTGLKRSLPDSDTNYVAVPQYTITSQEQEIDVSDMFLTKDRTPPVNVKTVDVAAIHITSDNLDFSDSFMSKDYDNDNDDNDNDSMYLCKYCPKVKFLIISFYR